MRLKQRQPVADEYQSDEMLMKRGRWSLWSESRGSSLWHQCFKDKKELGGGKRVFFVCPVVYREYSRLTGAGIKPAWRCGLCYAKPPESILTVYLLNNFDTVSEEMTNR